jgi:serine/threonine protein kinase
VLTAILTTEPSPLNSHIVKPPEDLQQIVSKALQKNPDDRYHNANEILEALKALRRKLELAAELERSATSIRGYVR